MCKAAHVFARMKRIFVLWEALLDLVYPKNIYCMSCGRPIAEHALFSLCDSCVRMLSYADAVCCSRCGRPMNATHPKALCEGCQQEQRHFEAGITCVRYSVRERELVHDFKYHGKAYLGEPLGELMCERLRYENFREDLIVPVPMYPAKERKRGYNQAALLAKQVARSHGKPCFPHLLRRTRDTEPMSRLTAEQRRANAATVFCVRGGLEHLVFEKTVLLIDDVFTTGSTADACARVLMAAGATRVFIATFAAVADLSRIMELSESVVESPCQSRAKGPT